MFCPLPNFTHTNSIYRSVSRYLLAGMFICAAFFCASWASAQPAELPKLRLVCTTGMIADVVKNVAGTRGDVVTLMGAGIDPHLYKPTRTDIATLTEADVVFYNGLLLEGKMVDALIRVATLGRKVLAVTDELEPSFLLEPAEFAGHSDPHVWMDPVAWEKVVAVVEKSLSEHDPKFKEIYATNAGKYLDELQKLHQYSLKVLSTVPSESRVLITAHDAFNYFGRRYGYEVLGIQGISTESEAGVRDIERLVQTLVERKIKAVFVESTVSERNIRALIEGARARQHVVTIGGQLFSDAMGPADRYEGTYVGMIDHNVTTIAKSLGGNVPPGGMQGKLSLR